MHELLSEFRAPSSAYRGKPFWAWNGELEPEELRRQIRVLERMGMGGFFMHSRVGLGTEYLGPRWFECIDACVEESKALGMQAWLYDEDRWPSGAAGGLVTQNPAYRQQHLRLKVLDQARDFSWSPMLVAAFTARIEGAKATSVERIPQGAAVTAPANGSVILAFEVESAEPSDWYNGATYLDTLSHEAVAEFIRVTHAAYAERCGAHFGTTIPGIFADEPNHDHMMARDGTTVPWTRELPQTFEKRYGYDLVARLPEVFFDIDEQPVSQARYHYHDCVTQLFVEAFSKQIGRWCDEHQLMFTGHVLGEETLASQASVVGSAMRFYEYMQAPGMDILTEYNREYDTAKQVSSMARQFGRRWRLTETYGCTGWDFPFVGHKAIGDWQLALGINLRCQHLSWYTMQGEAKRDYPAGIFYQSPWWETYSVVEDYFARLHVVMTQGTEVRDLLVIHPIESRWLSCNREWPHWHNRPNHWLDESIIKVRDALLAANIDFDYGDEDVIARHARVASTSGQPAIVLGQASYKAVVVPPQITMRKSTLELLKEFQSKGGNVVFAGTIAEYVDALPSRAVRELAASSIRTAVDGDDLPKAVENCRRVSISDGAGHEIAETLYLLREDDAAQYLFVCNVGHDFRKTRPGTHSDVPVRERTARFDRVVINGFAGCAGEPLELDPATGAFHAADSEHSADGFSIVTSLAKLGSRLFVIPKRPQTSKPPARETLVSKQARELTGPWRIALSECNNAVLDRAEFRIGDAEWQPALEILKIDDRVHAALGIRKRGGAMVQPWARQRAEQPKSVKVALRYAFDVAAIPSGDLQLALEEPKRFRITLNGHAIDPDAECGWWTDRSLCRVPVDPTLLKLGKNELLLECDYAEDFSGLEIVYLLGQFGTRIDGQHVVLTEMPRELELGDWVAQGLAFYSGSVSYLADAPLRPAPGEHVFVQVPEYAGVGVRVLVDGRPVGVIAWEPNELEITEALRDGAQTLAIQVLGHRRNSHGPLHYTEKWPRWTGPSEFKSEGDRWTDEYQLVPCGLMQAPRVVIKTPALAAPAANGFHRIHAAASG